MRTHTLNGEEIQRCNKPGVERKMNPEIANKYLQDLKKVFDEFNINFCLFYGTLVGALREEDFIAHDHDVDVVVFEKDEKEIEKTLDPLRALGYAVSGSRVVDGERNSFYISRKDVPKQKVDVYYLWLFKDHYWFPRYTHIQGRGPTIVAIPYEKQYFQDMEEVMFLGAKYKVPTPPEEFLEKMWGDWWIPHNGQFGKIKAEKFTIDEFKQLTQEGGNK
jgi:glycerol-3-phosphate cytidylyltransferase